MSAAVVDGCGSHDIMSLLFCCSKQQVRDTIVLYHVSKNVPRFASYQYDFILPAVILVKCCM